ncbi:thioredoxin family protein [Neolewinella aurantiaca]|uniref:Thioredoxin family protein n=1 Tax=Neolewinella aurantiaca TaxID=2602767 RepID=A0A5C7FES0_9BACT|nr:thioredoxin family protein [Neolewinella aurantiaca]TXF89652.1 thioredoxin family protein [Neolewinella aurantiaca]
MTSLITDSLSKAQSYAGYRQMLTELLEDEGKTTGPNQSEQYIEIAHLNQARMNRLDRKPKLTGETSDFLAALDRELILLVLTEGWCGDAAQILPVLNWMADESGHLQLYCLLRDENLELMDKFLTNGARAIPEVIILDAKTKAVLGNWGPRPEAAQQMVMDYKQTPESERPEYAEFQKQLHTWYARDKTRSTQGEVVEVLKSAVV